MRKKHLGSRNGVLQLKEKQWEKNQWKYIYIWKKGLLSCKFKKGNEKTINDKKSKRNQCENLRKKHQWKKKLRKELMKKNQKEKRDLAKLKITNEKKLMWKNQCEKSSKGSMWKKIEGKKRWWKNNQWEKIKERKKVKPKIHSMKF